MILACERCVLLSSLHKSNNLLKNILYKSFKGVWVFSFSSVVASIEPFAP